MPAELLLQVFRHFISGITFTRGKNNKKAYHNYNELTYVLFTTIN